MEKEEKNLLLKLKDDLSGCIMSDKSNVGTISLYMLFTMPIALFSISIYYFIDGMNKKYSVQEPRFCGDIYVISSQYININETYVNWYYLIVLLICTIYCISYLIIFVMLKNKFNQNKIYLKNTCTIIFGFMIFIAFLMIIYIISDNLNPENNLGKNKYELQYTIEYKILERDFIDNYIDKYSNEKCQTAITYVNKVKCDYRWDILKKYIKEHENDTFLPETPEFDKFCKSIITYLIFKTAAYNNYTSDSNDIDWINAINVNTNTCYNTYVLYVFLTNYSDLKVEKINEIISECNRIEKEITEKIMNIRRIAKSSTALSFTTSIIIILFFIGLLIFSIKMKKF